MEAINETKLDAFVQQAISDLAAGFGGVMVSLGHKSGLYKAMHGAGPATAHDVAERAGCAESYVREWLNSQAAGGYVVYDAAQDTYELPAEQTMVLADEDRHHVLTCPSSSCVDYAEDGIVTNRGTEPP